MEAEATIVTVRPMPAFLREWREWARLTQEECAEKMGMSGANLSRYETGHYKWKQSFLEKFAAAVGCPNPWDPIMGPPGRLPALVHLLTTLPPETLEPIQRLAEVLANPHAIP